ncbi:5-methylcytosine restriction system specificity protein McrC [Psychrobacter sp. 1U2]|uniref:5-methylcytosine restriction system specificity protein McrC n=1 Tax=Psychrobacter sp. 1U2 TaxID=3453577 RepID=UPI003F4760C9
MASKTNIDSEAQAVMSVHEHQRLTVQDFAYANDFAWLMAQELPVFSIKRQRGQWQLKVGHYIGVILLPSHITLEILPKAIANTLSEKSAKTSHSENIVQTRQWVEQMLSALINANDAQLPALKNFGQASANLTPLPVVGVPISQWLLEQFLQLLSRYQPSQHYQTKIQNQATLQGKLLIKEQLRDNSYRPHKFISEVSTLSTKMLSNRLIKSALQLVEPLVAAPLLPKYWLAWRSITALSPHEYQQLDSLYTSAKQQLSQQPVARQQRQASQQLLAFAYWLLKTQASTMLTGHGLSTQNLSQQQASPHLPPLQLCLLLNMNQAFEQWASLSIAASFTKLQGHYLPLYHSQHVWLKDQLGQAQLSMRPDLLIYRQVAEQGSASGIATRHCSHVIDIKWKLLAKASDISASDAYQLSSYAQAYQAQQVWLVYPVTDSGQRPIALHRHLDSRFSPATRAKNKAANGIQNQSASSTEPTEGTLWLMPFNVLTGQLLGSV